MQLMCAAYAHVPFLGAKRERAESNDDDSGREDNTLAG
jgi:hypothetical protein